MLLLIKQLARETSCCNPSSNSHVPCSKRYPCSSYGYALPHLGFVLLFLHAVVTVLDISIERSTKTRPKHSDTTFVLSVQAARDEQPAKSRPGQARGSQAASPAKARADAALQQSRRAQLALRHQAASQILLKGP